MGKIENQSGLLFWKSFESDRKFKNFLFKIVTPIHCYFYDNILYETNEDGGCLTICLDHLDYKFLIHSLDKPLIMVYICYFKSRPKIGADKIMSQKFFKFEEIEDAKNYYVSLIQKYKNFEPEIEFP